MLNIQIKWFVFKHLPLGQLSNIYSYFKLMDQISLMTVMNIVAVVTTASLY